MRSLSSTERYLELTYALENIDCDIIGLSEVRRMGCNIEEYQDYILCYIGQTKGLHGVGFLIKKALKDKIINFTGISERVALLQLKFAELSFSIIQTYAPTERTNDDDILKFYNDIKKAHTLANDTVLIIGDFNAKIGHPKPEENLIMGKYGYGERNERGEQLIDFALEYKLSIMNTFFKKRASRKWTWKSPDHTIMNEIDFIMTSNPKLINNVEVLSNVKFPSDHRMVRATCLIKHPRNSRKNFNTKLKTPITEGEVKGYLDQLKSRVGEGTGEGMDVQEHYNSIEEAIIVSLSTSKETNLNKRLKVISENTEQLIKRRTKLIKTRDKDKNMRKELSKLFKETNKAIKKDYSKHRHAVISRNLKKFRSTKRAFKELNLHKSWVQKLENKTIETKTRKDIIDFATNFYQKLYKRKQDDDSSQQQDTEAIHKTLDPIDEKEVFDHIKHLKSEKSPGPDGLSNEAIKLGAPILLKSLTRLFNMVLDTETVPKQWCTSDIILLYKKGNPLDIGNYRPISLLTSMYKLFASILLKRITPKIDESQPIEQAGFRSGFSTTDHIHALEQVISKYKEFNRPLYVAFIDYSKAFDSISHNSIWNTLQLFDIDQKYINVIKNIYANSTSRVKLETRGGEITIERGVRQGDPLSPKLFIAVLETIFMKLKWKQKGIEMNGRYLSHFQFADDIVVLANKVEELEKMISSLDQESSKVGLEMNANKTKIMTNSIVKPIHIKGNDIEYVKNYTYLGKHVSFNKISNQEEIERRANITWRKYWSLKEIMKGDYSLSMKKVVIDTCLLPCLLYGCQTWVFTNKVKHKIRSTQRAMERSILKIRKIHKVRSDIIRQKTKLTDALTQALKLKWQWAGHISRLTDKRWTIQTTQWKGPAGKRNVGRPYRRWADDIIQMAGKDWMSVGKDRVKWKKLEEAFTQEGVRISEPEVN